MSNVRYLKKNEYEYWDKFVDLSEQGSCFSKSWWLKVSTSDNFKICIYEGDGEIFAGLILPYFDKKKITMPRLTQSVGILFFNKKGIKPQKRLTNQKEQTNSILDFIGNDIKSFDINFHYNYSYWLPFYWKNFKETTKYTYIINYDDFNEKIHFSSLSKGHKWSINRVTKKSDLKMIELTDLKIFYKMSQKTYERQGIKIGYSYDFLNSFHQELLKNNAGKMFMSIDEDNNIHAVNYIVYDKHEAYYWLGASDVKYRSQGGHTYLIWETIKYFKEKSERFNFGGSMMEDVEKNFRNFSGELKPYFNIFSKDRVILREFKAMIPQAIKNKIKFFI